MRKSLTWLVVALLLLPSLPAQAKISFGLVPGADRLFHTEKDARDLTDYLAAQLSEEVSVQTFSNESTLYDWLNRYRMVDVAIFSDRYLASQRPGEVSPLADYVSLQSPQATSPELIVARQGLTAGEQQKLQSILLKTSDDPAGREILKQLGILAIVPAGTRPEELAGMLPPPPVAAEKPSPPPPVPVALAQAPPAKSPEPARPEPPPAAVKIAPAPSQPSKAKGLGSPPSGDALREIASSTKTTAKLKPGSQSSYSVEPVADGIYAATTMPGGNATSNAFFVVGPEYVVAGGAHMTQKAIEDLLTSIRSVTDKPLRHFILAHHHAGYNHIDFDFPAGVDLIISWQTWKAMDDEIRELNRPTLFYSDGLTLKLGEKTIILTNMGRAHTEGDSLVFFPESEVLFTSDLVYVNSVGYMGDGHMEDWLLALEFIERLGAKKIIPGFGPVSPTGEIVRFKDFFRELVTEVLKHLGQGDSLEQTVQSFSLPGYGHYSGYEQFLRINVRRAYIDLKENFIN